MTGPLTGVRVVEVAAVGPVPFAVRLLAQLGADVLRVSRPSGAAPMLQGWSDFTGVDVTADLKQSADVDAVLALIAQADVLLEGMRPGVMERLGLGPDVCLARNPSLVFGRMTGWGQEGPKAQQAGHDINFIALTGLLDLIGTRDRPVVPLNLIGDYAGGALYLVVGVLAALLERGITGRGRVIDAAIIDGTAALIGGFMNMDNAGALTPERESNLLDGGSPCYRTYACADGGFMAVGALELPFYRNLLGVLGLDEESLPDREDRANWPELAETLSAVFATEDRDTWTQRFAGVDACATPVLSMAEAADDAHLAYRGTIVRDARGLRAANAPRFMPADEPAASVTAQHMSMFAAIERWARPPAMPDASIPTETFT